MPTKNYKTHLLTSLLITILLLAFGASASGKVISVPEDYDTIQAAVDAAGMGDTVEVGPGSYGGFTMQGKQSVTVRTVGEGDTVIEGTVQVLDSKLVNLSGFTITGEGDGLIICGNTSHFTASNNSMIKNEGKGILFCCEGNFFNIKVKDNKVNKNGGDGMDVCGRGRKCEITDNDINYNGRTTAGGVGLRLGTGLKDVLVEGNEIVGNPFAGIHA